MALAAFVILGLVLVLGSTPAHAAQLTVSWSDATPDDHTGFKVERKTGTNGTFAQVGTTGQTVMAYLDTTLTAGTTYCYRVRAYNTAGNSPYTPEGCAVAPTPVVRTLTVAKTGPGTGTVDSSPNGITCGGTCSATYTSGTTVSLSASPATGATFTGWSGACTGTGGCAVVLDANKSATATFAQSALTTYALSVSKSGTGTGTVTANTGGINCGSTCSGSYNSGTTVTLTATAATGSTFTGWSGGVCTGTGTCAVNMTAARSATATFTTTSGGTTFPLSVTKAGTRTGTVTSNTGGINCGSTCSATVAAGTSVTLTAAAASGSTFSGWSGACTGTGSCAVSMTAARSVTATFALSTSTTYALTVSKAGTGTGTVTSNTGGINCGTACGASYTSGTSVTLTAASATGSTFTGWSRACNGTAPCTLSMTQARNVTATFATQPLTLASFTASPGGTLAVRMPVTATATATGGAAPYRYKWWVYRGTAWTLLQDWTPSNTYTWTPSTAGSYQLGVWVKNGNAVGDVGAVYGARPVTIAPATVSLAASPGGAQAVGTPITATATATGVTSPTYRFWLWDGHTWSVIREWGSNTVTWTPSVANPQTQLGVWVKPSSAAGDVWAAYGARPVPIAPATVSLAASPGGAQAVGTPITATATATGVTSPTYRFWLWDGHTWSVIREWGSNTVTWTPRTAGSYQLGVWVKPSSAAGDVWAAYGARPVTVR